LKEHFWNGNFQFRAGVAKLRPAKYLAHFFQAPRFRLWTAVQQH